MNLDVLDRFLEMGWNCLDLLLVATWRALPLLLIASLVGLVMRRQIASKYHALLWSLVVIRLLLPVSLPSSGSVHGHIDGLAAFLLDTAPTPSQPLLLVDQARGSAVDSGAQGSLLTPTQWDPARPPKRTVVWHEVVWLGVLGTWAVLAAGLLLRSLLAHIRFARGLRACRELDDPDLIDILLRECDSLRVPRRPRVKEVAELSAPAVFGLFRSTICLPVNAIQSLSARELRWVLRHELAHACRRDAWLHSLASIAQSLHWFNPLAWLATSRIRLYVEAAADDLAIASFPSQEAIAYGRLLLRFAEQPASPEASPALGFLQFGSGRRLRRRIELLTQRRQPRRRWAQGMLAVAILALAVAGLTDASERSESSIPPQVHLLQIDQTNVERTAVLRLDGAGQGPRTIAEYDVSEVLERIRQLEPDTDAEKALLATLLTIFQATTSNGSTRIDNGRLIADMTATQHDALKSMLDAWRAGGPRQICVELRVIQADLEHASSIDWVTARVHEIEQGGAQPVIAARVTDEQFRSFIQSVQSDSRSGILQAPKVTVFNGQSATIADLAQRPIVTAVDPQEDGSLQPIIELLEEGWTFMLHPVTTGDSTVQLTFDLRASKTDRVAMANLPFRHPQTPHPHVTIQVPSVSTTSVHSTVKLSAAETLLIAAPRVFDETSQEQSTMALFYAITPRLVDETRSPNEATSHARTID